jgi:outer membrane protein TolC
MPTARATPSGKAGITAGALLTLLAAGCAVHGPKRAAPVPPNVAPLTEPAPVEALQLDATHIKPMYTELLAIDLPSVVQVASAQNFDIRRARQAVIAARGKLESAVGSVFPALVPTALFDHVEGTVRATEGNLVGVGFNTFQPSLAIQWVINPGRVVHTIIAAKKRFLASEQQERAVILETLRKAVVQYYDLVLAQTSVSAAHQGLLEAQELLRINQLHSRAGTGVPADVLRAQARLAQRRQDLVVALKDFYDASLTLAVTLRLEPVVTLVPRIDQLPPVHLVREELAIEELLGIAVTFRPDLEQVRTLVAAVVADQGATWWGAFGPQIQAGYQYGGITGHADDVLPPQGIPSNLIVNPLSPTGSFSTNPVANGMIKEGILRASRRHAGRDDQTYGFSDQQRITARLGWRLSLSAFGDLKSAQATADQARIEATRLLHHVKTQVVRAAQTSHAHLQLTHLARRHVAAADEALRLSQAGLQAGSMTTLDVLQAQDAATQARLRYATAVVRYNQAQVNLLAALGLLNETTLDVGQASPPGAG